MRCVPLGTVSSTRALLFAHYGTDPGSDERLRHVDAENTDGCTLARGRRRDGGGQHCLDVGGRGRNGERLCARASHVERGAGGGVRASPEGIRALLPPRIEAIGG